MKKKTGQTVYPTMSKDPKIRTDFFFFIRRKIALNKPSFRVHWPTGTTTGTINLLILQYGSDPRHPATA